MVASMRHFLRASCVLAATCAALCWSGVAAVGPRSADGGTILVILDDASMRSSHSQFLSSLEARGYATKILTAGDASVSLISDGEYAYDGLFLLCPTSTKSSRSLQPSDISAFVSSGRSVFVAAAPAPSSYIKSVAKAIGVVIHSTVALDHQHAVSGRDRGSHTYIAAGGRDESAAAVWASEPAAVTASASDVHFVGPAATLAADNELVAPVLWADDAAYAGTPGSRVTKTPVAVGRELVFAAILSSRRSGGRAVYWGSVETLANVATATAPAGHAATMRALAGWSLGERGVLRSRDVGHQLLGRPPVAGEEAATYRVRDDVAFSLTLEEWDGPSRAWVPYVASDVQAELVMLNPSVRKRLAAAGAPGRYSAKLRVPDVIGIYSFRVAYYRTGLTPVEVTEVVSVRPFLHNEFERFIPQAYPYYAGAFSMLFGALMLTGVLLQS